MDAERIVDLVCAVREANPRNHGYIPSVRASIRIAQIAKMYGGKVAASASDFVPACIASMDVVFGEIDR